MTDLTNQKRISAALLKCGVHRVWFDPERSTDIQRSMFRIMQDSGYLSGFDHIDDGRGGQFVVHLNGRINKCGAICPRYSVQLDELEYFEEQFLPAKNFGMLIISTSRGVMSHEQARKEGIGGELLGYVY